MILNCGCKHLENKPEYVVGAKYQDKMYGEGMRVHNLCPSSSGDEWRCSICNVKRTAKKTDDKKKKDGKK